MDKAHVLIVDDDREIRDLLSRFLRQHGYRVSVAVDGREMWRALDEWGIDLVVLDLMLPGEDGLSLCRRLRAGSDVPVIMLTAMGEEIDRIVGLEMGADDYLAKPFNPHELLARSRAVLRRTRRLAPLRDLLVTAPPAAQGEREAMAASEPGPPGSTVDPAAPDVPAATPAWPRRVERLSFSGWRLDLAARELHSPEGVLVPLTAGEFALLAAFATHPQRVLSREQLLDLARGRDAQPFDRAIDVQVSRLRRKLEAEPREPTLIKTVRAGGYLFAARVEAE